MSPSLGWPSPPGCRWAPQSQPPDDAYRWATCSPNSNFNVWKSNKRRHWPTPLHGPNNSCRRHRPPTPHLLLVTADCCMYTHSNVSRTPSRDTSWISPFVLRPTTFVRHPILFTVPINAHDGLDDNVMEPWCLHSTVGQMSPPAIEGTRRCLYNV